MSTATRRKPPTVDLTREHVRERLRSALLLTRSGESAPAIAVRLGVHPRTVTRYRARLREQQAA